MFAHPINSEEPTMCLYMASLLLQTCASLDVELCQFAEHASMLRYIEVAAIA
jgi:hypothetical protein